MNEIRSTSQSLRSTRARALLPRIAVYTVLLVIGIAGIRTIIAGPAETPAAAPVLTTDESDTAAEAFAEGFASVYLSWDADHPNVREHELTAYLPGGVDRGDGFEPASGASQQIVWTAAMGAEHSGSALNVIVAARTEHGQTLHLSVPVSRDDEDGFLYIAGYPALVGPPPVAEDEAPEGEPIGEDGLRPVVERALTNYLAGARENLLADLSPDAVVSLPAIQLEVTSFEEPTWVVPNRRVAVLLSARDEDNNTWNLRYELDVRESDRWYVQGIEADPTLKGGA